MRTFIKSTFLLILLSTIIFSQQPGWIEQDIPESMTGFPLADRGNDVIVFTKSNSDIVYFFDNKANAWIEVNLGSVQNFQNAIADGYTAFAYSDEYLLAYSTVISQWDTVKYEGSVLDPMGVSTRKGYGCVDRLAYFVTNANIYYVFDAKLAQWYQYDFGLISNASGTNDFWATKDYAGAIFHRIGSDYAKNITYSLHTHSFTDLDQGGWYYYPDNIMHGGYVATWSDAATTSKFFGYCAATNEFKSVTFPNGFDVSQFEASVPYTSFERIEDIYVYTCGYVVGDTEIRYVTVKSYSTKTGNWYSFNYDYDPREISGHGWSHGGGSFSLGHYISDADQSAGLWKFYGTTGTHIGEIPGLYNYPVSKICGGKVAVVTGHHNMWFHNFETASSKHKYFAPNDNIYYANQIGAENYCVSFRVDQTSDTMRVFFFNGLTNNLQSIYTNKLPHSVATATPRAYGYVTGGPNNDVIFYSEELDSVILYHAPESYGSITGNNYFLAHTFASGCAIFDASTAQIYERDFSLSSNSIGDSLIFVRSGDLTELTAFSGITKNWSVQQAGEYINGLNVGDQIALAYTVSATKYWGYSAYDDTFYELDPQGSFVNPTSMAGSKVGFVQRSTHIYAFSPGEITSIADDKSSPINKFALYQNYPNPFNPVTKIEYSVPAAAHIKLEIFDITGRSVVTLVNTKKMPGKYEVVFDGSELASGMYLYHLKTDTFSKTKKMLILK